MSRGLVNRDLPRGSGSAGVSEVGLSGEGWVRTTAGGSGRRAGGDGWEDLLLREVGHKGMLGELWLRSVTNIWCRSKKLQKQGFRHY